MTWELLLDIEVVLCLDALPKSQRSKLIDHFQRIQDFPGQFAEGITVDDVGRRIEITSHAGWMIYYWTDFSNQHVKILKLRRA